MKITEFIKKVEDCSLPYTEWTHFAHIRVALWYVYHSKEPFEALYRTKCTLIQYSSRANPGYKCVGRYSETATNFWVNQIQKFVEQNINDDIDTLVEKIQNTQIMDSKYILNFYSQETLSSYEAKATHIKQNSQEHKSPI